MLNGPILFCRYQNFLDACATLVVVVKYNFFSVLKYFLQLKFLRFQRKKNVIKNILNLNNTDVDTKLLYDVISVIKEDPSLEHNLLDSFSSNQVASKYALLNAVDNLNFLYQDSTVVIWGSWYGSILIPALANKVKKIVSIDLDETPLQIAKNRLFANYKNIEYVCDDIFKTYRDV